AMTSALRLSSLAPAMVKRSRKRSICGATRAVDADQCAQAAMCNYVMSEWSPGPTAFTEGGRGPSGSSGRGWRSCPGPTFFYRVREDRGIGKKKILRVQMNIAAKLVHLVVVSGHMPSRQCRRAQGRGG